MRRAKVQNQSTIKYHNINTVWNIIRDFHRNKPISRADIAKMTEMSPTSITRITSVLLKAGLISEAETFSSGVGRKGTNLRVVEDAFYSLGISIDSDYIRICILDCGGNIIKESYDRLHDRFYKTEEVINIAKKLYDQLCEENPSFIEKVKVVGVSCTGNINNITGDVYFAAQMKWNKKFNLKTLVENIFKLPVFVDNDLKMALLGATFQSDLMKRSDVSYVTIGTGIGVSVMYNGKIIRGISNAAGELGHTIFEPNGRTCVCGRKGCLAAYITEKGLVNTCRRKGCDVNSIQEIMHYYNEKEPWAVEEIHKFADNIAILLCNIIYIYNTKFILVSGSIIVNFPIIFDMAYKKLKSLIHENLYFDVIIKPILHNNSSVRGAAYVAQNQYISQLIKEYAN